MLLLYKVVHILYIRAAPPIFFLTKPFVIFFTCPSQMCHITFLESISWRNARGWPRAQVSISNEQICLSEKSPCRISSIQSSLSSTKSWKQIDVKRDGDDSRLLVLKLWSSYVRTVANENEKGNMEPTCTCTFTIDINELCYSSKEDNTIMKLSTKKSFDEKRPECWFATQAHTRFFQSSPFTHSLYEWHYKGNESTTASVWHVSKTSATRAKHCWHIRLFIHVFQ